MKRVKGYEKIKIAPFMMNFEHAIASMINGRNYLAERGFENLENSNNRRYNSAEYNFKLADGRTIGRFDFTDSRKTSSEGMDALLLDVAQNFSGLEKTDLSGWNNIMQTGMGDDIYRIEFRTDANILWQFGFEVLRIVPIYFNSNAIMFPSDPYSRTPVSTLKGFQELKTGLETALSKTNLDYDSMQK